MDLINDLLDMNASPKQMMQKSPLDLLEQLNELQPPSKTTSGGSDEVLSHRFYYAHADRFSPHQTAKMTGQTLDMKTCANGSQWKAMLPFSMS